VFWNHFHWNRATGPDDITHVGSDSISLWILSWLGLLGNIIAKIMSKLATSYD